MQQHSCTVPGSTDQRHQEPKTCPGGAREDACQGRAAARGALCTGDSQGKIEEHPSADTLQDTQGTTHRAVSVLSPDAKESWSITLPAGLGEEAGLAPAWEDLGTQEPDTLGILGLDGSQNHELPWDCQHRESIAL